MPALHEVVLAVLAAARAAMAVHGDAPKGTPDVDTEPQRQGSTEEDLVACGLGCGGEGGRGQP